MKKIAIVSFLGLALVAGSAFAQSDPQGHAGFIKSVRGEVQIIDTSAHTRIVRTGDPIAQTDRLVTGRDGGASLVLRDGTTMVVGPSSELNLQQFRFDATTQEGNVFVSLLRGSMRMITGLVGKNRPEAVRVDTQTATIGIRGTDFIVVADKQI